MPTGDAPTKSEWPTILLPTKVRLILETDSTHTLYFVMLTRTFLFIPWSEPTAVAEDAIIYFPCHINIPKSQLMGEVTMETQVSCGVVSVRYGVNGSIPLSSRWNVCLLNTKIIIHYICNNLAWNCSNTMHILSELWLLMAWCFSTRASVATVLSAHPCISTY